MSKYTDYTSKDHKLFARLGLTIAALSFATIYGLGKASMRFEQKHTPDVPQKNLAALHVTNTDIPTADVYIVPMCVVSTQRCFKPDQVMLDSAKKYYKGIVDITFKEAPPSWIHTEEVVEHNLSSLFKYSTAYRERVAKSDGVSPLQTKVFSNFMSVYTDTEKNYAIGFGSDILNTVFLPINRMDGMSREDIGYIIAHELGHVWGLDHVSDENNLMNPSFVSPDDATLTPEQIDSMHIH